MTQTKFEVTLTRTAVVEIPEVPWALKDPDAKVTTWTSIADVPDETLVRIGEAWTAKLLEEARRLRADKHKLGKEPVKTPTISEFLEEIKKQQGTTPADTTYPINPYAHPIPTPGSPFKPGPEIWCGPGKSGISVAPDKFQAGSSPTLRNNLYHPGTGAPGCPSLD